MTDVEPQPRPIDEVLYEVKASAATDGRAARGPVDPGRPLPALPGEELVPPQSLLQQWFPGLDEEGTDWDALGREGMGPR